MEDLVRFRKGTDRNTQCYELYIADVRLIISYQTVIAARYGGEMIRRHNDWGPTTGRHMRETYVRDYLEIDDEDTFNARVNDMILRSIADRVTLRMVA
jgi:hypothetical protein